MRLLAFLFSLLILFTVFIGLGHAQDAPIPANQGRVTDLAGVFTADQKERLAARLKDLEKTREDSPQVLVLTTKGVPDNDIVTFGVKVFEAWKPGTKGRDSGLLIIIDTNHMIQKNGHEVMAKNVRFEVGYGLEPVIGDIVSHDIITEVMGPKVKGKNPDWFGATMAAADAIGTRIEKKVAQDNAPPVHWSAFAIFIVFLLFGVGGVIVFLAIRAMIRSGVDFGAIASAVADSTTTTSYGSSSGSSSGRSSSSNDWSSGGGSSGGGGANADLSDD